MKEEKEAKTKIRCAIYTRKSTNEGLDQEFTSLDAQRESAESYIKSQQHQGWVSLSDKYDDGGFTGATIDRPALQKLLEDIKEKKVDCVVVYKVDRLSRSLLDFTKLLQFFDDYGTAFVSVTQHFNTNTSMGRLTLNILLSFAQFEREMISERTKDKMGAARMKGRWIGGRPGLGYDINRPAKRLIINEEEAKVVRSIFSLYLEKKSLLETAKALNQLGYRTKVHNVKDRLYGGVLFSITNVQIILNNHVYIGKVLYEGKIYPGLHDPIVSEEVFYQVQEILKQNKKIRGVSKNTKFLGLLSGLFRCKTCEASMCHSYTKKKNNKYRYYICLNAIKRNRKECPTKSISAMTVEENCLSFIRKLSGDSRLEDKNWKALSLEDQRVILQELVQTIEYDGEKGKLTILMKNDPKPNEFDLPLESMRRRIVDSSDSNFTNEPPIRRQLLLAHQIQKMLETHEAKDLKQIAGWINVSKTRLYQIMNLLFLAPMIQEDIITGDSNKIAKIGERTIRPILVEMLWEKQLEIWEKILS